MNIQMLVQTLENIVKKAGKKQESFPKAGTSTLSEKLWKVGRPCSGEKRAEELVSLGADKSGNRVVIKRL